jgi:hypothetical protein
MDGLRSDFILGFDNLAELAHAASQCAKDFWQLPNAKEHRDNDQDEKQLDWTDFWHDGTSLLYATENISVP